MSRYEFNREKAYRLVGITDRVGRDKVATKSTYGERINCVAVNLRYDRSPVYGTTDAFRMKMTFIRDAEGQPIQRKLHTGVVCFVEKTERGLKIHTQNSIYVMEEAEVTELMPLDEANLIELYLSLDDDCHFAAGFYYDADRKAHELVEYMHVGMFTDSVLIGTYEDALYGSYVCRYYWRSNSIEFYDTIYGQQDYSTLMLIHNTGKRDLIIQFEFYPKKWTIKPGESKMIIPFSSEGADLDEAEHENEGDWSDEVAD